MLKIKDLNGKKIIYKWDCGDTYYWDCKYVVEVDDDNVALINMQGSYSGWIRFGLESVDICFVSAFFDVYGSKFEKCDEVFDYSSEEEYEPASIFESEVILIRKDLIQEYVTHSGLVEKIEE